MSLPFSQKTRQAFLTSDFALNSDTLSTAKRFIEKVLTRPQSVTESELEDAKLLATSKLLLSLSPYQLIARFAGNYSRLWRKRFVENPSEANEFSGEVFPTLARSENGVYSINVFDYLASEESISFVELKNGNVTLSHEDFLDALCRQVRKKALTVPQYVTPPIEARQFAQSLATEFAASIPKGKKFLEKPDIKQILLGVAEGGRFYACMKLCRACFKDGLSLEEAKQIILGFVKACPPSKNPFTEKEALTCLEWLYRKGNKTEWSPDGAIQ